MTTGTSTEDLYYRYYSYQDVLLFIRSCLSCLDIFLLAMTFILICIANASTLESKISNYNNKHRIEEHSLAALWTTFRGSGELDRIQPIE
jgi:hypothetical protein